MELKEEWRDIQGFPNYQISNLGNVKSKKGCNTRWKKLNAECM